MKRFVLAPALAALVMFVFGAIYWMTPLPYRSLGRVPDDAAAMQALDKIFPATGDYLVPGMYLESKLHADLSQKGPTAEVHIVKTGMKMVDPVQLVSGYVHEFILCLVLVVLLHLAGVTAAGPGRVVKVCATLGLLFAVYDFSYAIWWGHAWAWQGVQAVYDLLAFVFVGLVLAKLVTTKAAPVYRDTESAVSV